MFRVIGRILIFVFSLALIVLGLTEAFYFFIQYIHIFDALHIALCAVQIVLSLIAGVGGIITISKSKRSRWNLISYFVLFGLGIYYLVICNGHPNENYYMVVGVFNVIITFTLFISAFWNRKRF